MVTKDPFIRTRLQEHLCVKELVSLHYFEFSKDYIFEGEKHDFWEFLYVDKGELEVFADTEGYRLKQGDILFHKPNEFHSVWANKKIAPNAIVISFVCRSAAMSFFKDKLFHLSERQQNHLAQLLKFGFAAFLPPFDDPRNHTLKRRKAVASGTEQLIKLHLELLLIELLHSGDPNHIEQRISGAAKTRSEVDLVRRMCLFMEQHLYDHIQLEHIYKTFNLSKSHALKIFKDRTGQPLMKYYRNLKIEQAKQMIREQLYNFTEIAERLQYSSVHNFSRQFKSVTDMSPSEYARTVMAKL
ncbi:MAG: hypothetical protein K0R67_1131 [Paenibacillus sp.]|jgi:AraC-like DNA-binding protein|nr:hypothetical protein [Paenibacillus sp.]